VIYDLLQRPATTDLSALGEQLVATSRTQGVKLTEPGGPSTGLARQVLETELAEHLGHERAGRVGQGAQWVECKDGAHRCRRGPHQRIARPARGLRFDRSAQVLAAAG
jgi:hypothetical protein